MGIIVLWYRVLRRSLFSSGHGLAAYDDDNDASDYHFLLICDQNDNILKTAKNSIIKKKYIIDNGVIMYNI